MSIATDPKYQPFIDVLGMRLFRIPNYQRAYSWNVRQIEDLFDDISKLYDKPETNKHDHHFMATIVCLNTSQKEELGSNVLPVLHVVDGQQRLTTLIILLKAIAKKMTSFEDEISKDEAKALIKLLVKDDDRLILLQTNHDSSNIFRNYLKDGTIPSTTDIQTTAEKSLQEAFGLCETFVDQWHNTKKVINLLKIVKNKLDFIFYELSDEQSVYTVFEVLNSRGLPVDSLDKCKSMLMGIAFEKLEPTVSAEKIDELHSLWSRIYRTIGLVNIRSDEILRFTATLNHPTPISQPLSEDEALVQFRRKCEAEPTIAIEITQKILSVTAILTKLSKTKCLEAVTEISYARLLAVSIFLDRSLVENDRKDVIKTWERITFKVFELCGKDSRFSRGDFTKLAYDVYNSNMGKDKITERLLSIGAKYPIEEALKNISKSDCYNNWGKELRYFLYQYEEYLAEKAGEVVGAELWERIWDASPSTTIEHIHPQEPSADWSRKIDFADNIEIIAENVHRLGNLALLPPGENSRIKNYSFETKKTAYRSSGLRMVQALVDEPDWNLCAIEQREDDMIEFAKHHWN